MRPQLFHFSEEGAIRHFEPRAVRVASQRPPGQEWLNGPLVWAIDEWHSPLYLFPRECPRIMVWRTAVSTQQDVDVYMGTGNARMVAYVEKSWLARIETSTLFRYEVEPANFEPLEDAGMWVSRSKAGIVAKIELKNLPTHLFEQDVELRCVDELSPLRDVSNSTLQASGIRLRNARGWP